MRRNITITALKVFIYCGKVVVTNNFNCLFIIDKVKTKVNKSTKRNNRYNAYNRFKIQLKNVSFTKMMRSEKSVCPLLDNLTTYVPDTIDLLENEEARNYWLTCIDNMVKSFRKNLKLLNEDKNEVEDILKMCQNQFHQQIELIRKDPSVVKSLSVRTLLEIYESILEENGIKDIWSNQKQKETEAAFEQFQQRIEMIDQLTDDYDKWVELSKGVVAGNMFDWGAKAVSEILEKSNCFGLSEAMNSIEQRPWFVDHVDKWIENVKDKRFQSVIVFVDNAGVDFVLGILPFVRQFLLEGASVYVAANATPTLNDVTYDDLKHYLQHACEKCNIIRQAIKDNKLITINNGQGGPCLDFRFLSKEACEAMKNVDLLIIEGMGRAIHTNYYAKFKVDSLKLAVIKNEWLAKKLGAKQFSVIFKYEEAIPNDTS